MQDKETRALVRALTLLVLVSVARWGWAGVRSGPVTTEESVLPRLTEAVEAAADEEE